MPPKQTNPTHDDTQSLPPSAHLGRAILIIAGAAIALIAFAAMSPAWEPEEQSAAAAAAIDTFKGISLEAKAAIVIDVQSGKTLYEKNADAQLPLASLTKVALALVIGETLPLDTVVTIPYYASGAASNARLLKGEQWRIADIVDFTLVESSNNGAAILADAANARLRELYPESPNEPHGAVLYRMNELARTLGLSQTYFLNVSGLDLSATQAGAYGSARDMAKLFAYAASAQAGLFAGTARNGVLLTPGNGNGQTAASNTNEVQGAIPGLIMGKTGLTDLAGGNLAVVFDVGLSHPLVAVVIGSSEHGRFSDMQKIIRAAREFLRGDE